MHDIDNIRRACFKNYYDLIRALKEDARVNERYSFSTSSELTYNSIMKRLRDLRCAIAHIEASDWDAFRDCPLGVYVVANYHAETMAHKTN